MGKSSKAPPAPDYASAARETAAGNLEAARYATQANRVNTYTPYGSLTYNRTQTPTFDQSAYDAALKRYNSFSVGGKNGKKPPPPRPEDYMTPGGDEWESHVNLSPTGQQLLDASNRTSLDLAALQTGAADRVGQMFGQPLPETYDPTKATNRASELINTRLAPQQARDLASLKTQLTNQGLAPGSEAWNEALDQLGRNQNDAKQQAELAGINLGQNQQQQAWTQETATRNTPMNELNAIRTGSQVTNPTFHNAPQQQTTAGPDLLGAANSQYGAALDASNASNAASANMMSGLFKVGATAAMMASDRRLKTDIKRVGTLDNGLPVYIYRFKDGGPFQMGVMAQEVLEVNPDAVVETANGFLAVKYGEL